MKSPAERSLLAGREGRQARFSLTRNLGLLAFERLNAPGWHLLYLDPSCHARWGVARTRPLRPDQHLRQLMSIPPRRLQYARISSSSSTPRGRYPFTSLYASGDRQLLELGERRQQGQQELLRGYLLEQPTVQEPAPALQQLQAQNQRLRGAQTGTTTVQPDHAHVPSRT